jgi:hypothetical protein
MTRNPPRAPHATIMRQRAAGQILVANVDIRSIELRQVRENLGCQLGQPSEDEIAASITTDSVG